jgi:hypothetical protein
MFCSTAISGKGGGNRFGGKSHPDDHCPGALKCVLDQDDVGPLIFHLWKEKNISRW